VVGALVEYFGPRAAQPFDVVEQDWSAEEFTRGCYGGRLGAGAWTLDGGARIGAAVTVDGLIGSSGPSPPGCGASAEGARGRPVRREAARDRAVRAEHRPRCRLIQVG
jgi:hypothetical protein